jgi:hypothetical protein
LTREVLRSKHKKMINLKWIGSPREISFDIQGMSDKLKNTAIPCYVVKDLSGRTGITNTGTIQSEGKGLFLKAIVPAFTAEDLGDASFKEDYQVKYAYKAGACLYRFGHSFRKKPNDGFLWSCGDDSFAC